MTRTTNLSAKAIIHSNQNFSSYLKKKKKKKVSIFENEANLELNHQVLINITITVLC